MSKLKKLICKLLGHKWFYYEGLGLVPIVYEICERCLKLNIGFPPPKTYNCKCTLIPYEFKNVHIIYDEA
jgi:hypothetical protein